VAFLEKDVPTGGTSAALTPRTRSQTQCKSGSKSIFEASHNVAFIEEDVPTGGTSAALTFRTRSQIQRERE
jgi:hypothetical protein